MSGPLHRGTVFRVAEVDVTELVRRLTSYSAALDRHNLAVQRAYEQAEESLANLRRVWGGTAAEDFYVRFGETTKALERFTEGARGIKALLDERLAALRAADLPMGGQTSPAPPVGQLRLSFPLAAKEQAELRGAFGYLQGLRRRDGVPIRGEPGWDGFTRARLDIGGVSFDGRSDGPKEMEKERQPGIHPVAMRHAEANAIFNAKRAGVSGGDAILYVDKTPCNWCKPSLSKGLLAGWGAISSQW